MFSCSLWVAAIANVLAQFLKPFFFRKKTGIWDWTLLFANGNFPSSHTATVAALTIRIGLDYGVQSVGFAISFIFGAIVIADATGIRQEVGKHAKYINDHIVNYPNNQAFRFDEMKELIGHTSKEVLGGFVLGVIIVLLSLLFCTPCTHS